MCAKSVVALVSAVILSTAGALQASKCGDYAPRSVGDKREYSFAGTSITSFGEGEASDSTTTLLKGSRSSEVVSIKETRRNGDVVYLDRTVMKIVADEPGGESRETTAETLTLVSKRGYFTLAARDTETGKAEWHEYDPPLLDLPADLSPGRKWKVGTIQQGTRRFDLLGQVVSRDSVETPAGKFTDCLKLLLTYTKTTGTIPLKHGGEISIKSGQGTTTLWYAKGVGIVREENLVQMKLESPADGEVQKVTLTQKLVTELLPGYKVK
jgi:hypothetical protein